MKAVTLTAYRQPLSITDVSMPTPSPGDLLVRVSAAGLNQLDEKIRRGEFKQILRYRPPFVLGHDLAGVVEAVGEKVSGFVPGDQVYARPRDGRIGTFTEFVAVDADDVAQAPTSITLDEAASLPLVALTAWQALVERGQLRTGQRVLIHAGAGGVGTIAIQLAKHLGAEVTTTVSAANTDFVTALGADHVVDYRNQDFADLVDDQDLVLDGVGPDNVYKSLNVLRPGGKAIGIAGPPDPVFARHAGLSPALQLAVRAMSAKTRHHARKLGVDYGFLFMHASGAQLNEIARLVDAGVVRPVLGEVIDFSEIAETLAHPRSGPGKTVARLAPEPR